MLETFGAAKSGEWRVLRKGADGACLICLPGAGGEVGIFEEMAACMGADLTVLALSLKEEFAAVDEPVTIERIASVCVSAIASLQLRGPFSFCGYSLGAIVAYEVASRLARQGEDIRVVAIVDTGNPAFAASLPPAQIGELRKVYMSSRARRYWRKLTSGDYGELLHAIAAKLAYRAGTRARRLLRKAFQALGRQLPEIFQNNNRFLFHAAMSYLPPPGALPLLIFRTEFRSVEFGGDGALGWGRSTTVHTATIVRSTGHVELMKRPHVAAFAAALCRVVKGGFGAAEADTKLPDHAGIDAGGV